LDLGVKNTAFVKTGWHSYLKRVVLPDAGQAQILETKRAFYAGVIWLQSHMVIEVAALSDDAAEKRLQQINRELEAFKREPF
jgi:hypothetical protein